MLPAGMHRLAQTLAVAFAFVASVHAAPPVVSVTATSPDPATRLAPQQAFYVRIHYESDQPLRFQAAGFLGGQKSGRLMMNPSPVYPAGKGEAIAWVAGDPGARLDEIRVIVHDQKWKPFAEVATKVPVEWHAGVPAAATAPWAHELSSAQQRIVSQAMSEPPGPTTLFEKIWFALSAVFVPLAFLSVPGYPLLQLYAFWKLRGSARLLSALPVSFMLPIYAYCAYALSKDSNLWPLFAIFGSPVALVITLTVILVARRQSRVQAA